MMMPANFTAVNSEVVYGGADLFSILADTTAPVWNAANVKKFNTNLITLISNSFFQKTVSNTLGVMFGGNWGGDDGKKIFGDDGELADSRTVVAADVERALAAAEAALAASEAELADKQVQLFLALGGGWES